MRLSAYAVLVVLLATASVNAQPLEIAAPDEWRSEAIKLPPDFARDMTWRGEALMRFSPGMFKQDSEQFFSYVYMTRSSGTRALDGESIRDELLKYYRGLSVEVAKLRGIEVDTQAFTLQLEASPTDRVGERRFLGKLTWLEPFATGTRHVLYLEIDHWRDDAQQQNYLFVCASPQQPGPTAVWKQLRDVREKSRRSRQGQLR